MNTKTSADHMADISYKLDVVVGFLATRGLENDAVVDRLLKLGLSRKVVATVSGLTENAINVRVHRAKGNKGKTGKKDVERSPEQE